MVSKKATAQVVAFMYYLSKKKPITNQIRINFVKAISILIRFRVGGGTPYAANRHAA
jgi:hypothetical protein